MLAFFRFATYVGIVLAITVFLVIFIRFNTLLLKTKKYWVWILQIVIVIAIIVEVIATFVYGVFDWI